jgi:ATP-dependent Clp protease ATP-binding subunit ClpA
VRERVLEHVRSFFRPEFLNRIDEIVVFHALGSNDIRQIVGLQIRLLAKRLKERNISIELSENAESELAAEGFDPAYGARPLKRVIQNKVLNPLAKQILEGAVRDGDSVFVDFSDGQFRFSPKTPVRTES